MFCRTGREAAKLFGLFAHHKGFLAKMGEVGSEVSVFNSSMTSIYKLWHSSRKIFAEVIFYKKVKSYSNYESINIKNMCLFNYIIVINDLLSMTQICVNKDLYPIYTRDKRPVIFIYDP